MREVGTRSAWSSHTLLLSSHNRHVRLAAPPSRNLNPRYLGTAHTHIPPLRRHRWNGFSCSVRWAGRISALDINRHTTPQPLPPSPIPLGRTWPTYTQVHPRSGMAQRPSETEILRVRCWDRHSHINGSPGIGRVLEPGGKSHDLPT